MTAPGEAKGPAAAPGLDLAQVVREHYLHLPGEQRDLYVGELVLSRIRELYPPRPEPAYRPSGALLDLGALPIIGDCALADDQWQVRNASGVVIYEGRLP